MENKEDNNMEGRLIRVLGKDLSGDKKLGAGLTGIKGISWSVSNAICNVAKMDVNKKIGELTEEELQKIEDAAKSSEFPVFLKNRRNDFDSGEDKHLLGNDLNLRKDFDIKRLKKIKSYKGDRHTRGLPVRGQRTKANFRHNRAKSGAVGVKKKK